MFWSKKKYATKEDIHSLHSTLADSFNNVKSHTSNIFEWINYFHLKHQEQEKIMANQQRLLQHLHEKISTSPLSKHEIREILDDHYAFKELLNRIKSFDQQINTIMDSHQPMHDKIHELHSKIEQIGNPPKPSFKEKLIQKITRNSKGYVKNLVFSLIQKYENISSLKLREIVVDEQGLCSKSSFYRILTEIEESDHVDVVRQGNEKLYLSKLIKRV